MDAADSGSKVLETSIHAQTLPVRVLCARNDRAKEVRPEHSGPTISLTAPIGNPPRSRSSTALIPVAASGRTVRSAGVSAEGIFCAKADSIWSLTAKDEAMANSLRHIFA
jgi:hypothetical protein